MNDLRKSWQHETFEHTADVGVRIRAPDLPGLFAGAGEALFSLIADDLDQVEPREERTIRLAESDREYLLFDWLNELLRLFETEGMLFGGFEVDVRDGALEATVRGEPVDRGRHRLHHEVKAITYHGLKLQPTDGGWLAEVIVDI